MVAKFSLSLNSILRLHKVSNQKQTKMSHFCSMDSLVIIFLSFFIFFCIGTATAGQENSIFEGLSREELVNWAGYGEEKLSTVVVNGKLLCHGKTPIDSHPIHGASVAVLCGTNAKTSKPDSEGTTDGQGEFLIDLPSHLHAIPNLERVCCVKVFRLPDSSPCSHSFTEKHKGIKLISIGDGVRKYSAYNIHLLSKPSQGDKKAGRKNRDIEDAL